MDSLGDKDEKDAAAIKRLKSGYEHRLQEQEEELDDQAGKLKIETKLKRQVGQGRNEMFVGKSWPGGFLISP